MNRLFKIGLAIVAAFTLAAFAQEPADSANIAADAPAAVTADSANTTATDSAAARQAQFDDFMNSTYDTGSSSSEQAVSQPESSSSETSGDGGLVLYDGNDTPQKPAERRVYSRDAPIFRFMATVGLESPSRGYASFEYIVAQELLNVGVHFTDYTDKVFQVGATVTYYPMEMRYFYMFLTNDWIHGSYDRDRNLGGGDFEEYEETLNAWRVVVGIGGEALFMMHFGMYIELGFEFFAANGDYYLHMSKKHGTFDNDNFKLPYGIGFLFPF